MFEYNTIQYNIPRARTPKRGNYLPQQIVLYISSQVSYKVQRGVDLYNFKVRELLGSVTFQDGVLVLSFMVD